MTIDPTRRAALVASIHAPWRATVAECLTRWASLDRATQCRSYLVVEGDLPGARETLGSSAIGSLLAAVEQVGAMHRLPDPPPPPRLTTPRLTSR